MIIEEVLDSVKSIPDPYIRVLTYGRIGVLLSKVNDPRFEKAFKLAFLELTRIEDPYLLIRTLLLIGYLTGLAGLKSAKKAFREAIINAEALPKELRDSIKVEAVDYLLSMGDIDEALFYATTIEDKKVKNKKLLEILEKALEELGGEKINLVYKRRKIEFILEQIKDEPYRSEAIVKVIRPLLSIGTYKRVMELIDSIKSKEWIKQALSEVLLFLRSGEGENVEGVIEYSKQLAKKAGKDIREDLAYIFAIHGFIEQATEIIVDLPNRKKIAGEIFESLLMRQPEKLQEFLENIPEEMINELERKIIKLMEKEEKRYAELIRTIISRTQNENILVGAVRYFLSLNDFEGAKNVILKIRTERARSIALGYVAYYLIRNGRIGDAVDVVLEIKDKSLASKLASEILIKAVEGEINEGITKEKKRKGNHSIPSGSIRQNGEKWHD
ncbi:hypothetical protein PNA2_1243 [Pyrococcus sp. NA2]|uniref:hypothetical protein n=1 Tax=Pyrococcus sp. (strain NA2) TaxID=342949 RepID=UPI000209ACBA|nr:hypothetical protein [Pyrococcus sp. NA2]AEC52158.1 hypothetical protein PNA2_1243 [Pyrococcus sp. NA2]